MTNIGGIKAIKTLMYLNGYDIMKKMREIM